MTLILLAVAAVVLVVGVTASVIGWRLRGKRLVTCPETRETVAVEIDAVQGAVTRLSGGTELRLADCTRWPERRNCGQDCVREIEAAPADCLVRHVLARWYRGKTCVACGRDVSEIDWTAHRPGLLAPGGESLEWRDLVPERIPRILETHRPICWDCHVARTFRRLHPGLVVDRPWRRGTGSFGS